MLKLRLELLLAAYSFRWLLVDDAAPLVSHFDRALSKATGNGADEVTPSLECGNVGASLASEYRYIVAGCYVV